MVSEININHIRHSNAAVFTGLLVFEINNFEFCIDQQYVVDIIEFASGDPFSQKKITSLIFSSEPRYTLVNIHGILKFPDVSIGKSSRLILIDTFGKKFSFIADRVTELIPVNELFLDSALDFAISQEKRQRFSGVLKFRDRRILMLNLETITKEFEKVTEFPMKLKTSKEVDEEIRNKLKLVMGIN